MSRILGVAISTLMDAMPMCPEIFIKICVHWITMMSLTRSDGRSMGYVGVLPDAFSLVGGNKAHQFLILSKNLMYNFFSFCCGWWFSIFGWFSVYYI